MAHKEAHPKASLHGLMAVVGVCLVISIVSIVSLTGWSDLRSQRQILNQSFLIPLEPSEQILITNADWECLSVDDNGVAKYGLEASTFRWDGEKLSTLVGGERRNMSVGKNNALVFSADEAAPFLSVVYSNAAQTAYIACARGGTDLFLQNLGFLTCRPFGRPFRVFAS
jgi:hypothetical protein